MKMEIFRKLQIALGMGESRKIVMPPCRSGASDEDAPTVCKATLDGECVRIWIFVPVSRESKSPIGPVPRIT